MSTASKTDRPSTVAIRAGRVNATAADRLPGSPFGQDPHRLPPTRAARQPRSRGVFLDRGKAVPDATPKKENAMKSNDLHQGAARRSMTIALFVAGMLIAMTFAAPLIVGDARLNTNPGPGLLATTAIWLPGR